MKRAVENIFTHLSLRVPQEKDGETLVFESREAEALLKFRNILKQERIRDAARRIMREGKLNGRVVFYLNKQAAYAGRLSFCEPLGESPLGPIEVEIECGEPEEVIRWLTGGASEETS